MVCGRCGQREAQVLVQVLEHNTVKKVAVCSSCAADLQPATALHALLEALEGFTQRSRPHSSRCPGCRTSFSDFKATGLFGCPECYDNFAAAVHDLLPRVHAGAYRHRGKTPGRR
jgi:protein arginine kinase activator